MIFTELDLIPSLKYLVLIRKKKYIASIFNILFPEGPVLFDSPRMWKELIQFYRKSASDFCQLWAFKSVKAFCLFTEVQMFRLVPIVRIALI